jgi:hypothetical protein
VHAGTAEPLRVSPPEAVAYLLELRPRNPIRASMVFPMGLVSPSIPCASVSVTPAGSGMARAQFLCHGAVRSEGHRHGVACCSLGRGTSKVGWLESRRGARHASPALVQGRSQNDGCTTLILRADRRAGLPHPSTASHRRVHGIAGTDVSPVPSVLASRMASGPWSDRHRENARRCAREGR